jgi:hypothetical protein
LKILTLEVSRNQVVKPIFTFCRCEFFKDRQTLGVFDIGHHLAAQGAVAHGFNTSLKGIEHLRLVEVGELLPEAFQVAEGVLIDEAHQSEELQEGILQRGRRQQQFVLTGKRDFQCIGDNVGRLVDIAQPMGFVDDHQIPGNCFDIIRLALGKMIGTDGDFMGLQRVAHALFDSRIVGF